MTQHEQYQLVRIVEYEGLPCDYIQLIKVTVTVTDDGVTIVNAEFEDWECEGRC